MPFYNLHTVVIFIRFLYPYFSCTNLSYWRCITGADALKHFEQIWSEWTWSAQILYSLINTAKCRNFSSVKQNAPLPQWVPQTVVERQLLFRFQEENLEQIPMIFIKMCIPQEYYHILQDLSYIKLFPSTESPLRHLPVASTFAGSPSGWSCGCRRWRRWPWGTGSRTGPWCHRAPELCLQNPK